MNKTRITLALITFGAFLACAVLFVSGVAKADEADFAYDVAAHDVPATPIVLAIGHGVCFDVAANGSEGLDTEAEMARRAGVSVHDAAVIIVVAIHDLCPAYVPELKAWLNSYTTVA